MVECTCYTAWSKLESVFDEPRQGQDPRESAVKPRIGFWIVAQSSADDKALQAFEKYAGPPVEHLEGAVALGFGGPTREPIALWAGPSYYPYSGQWNGYSPFVELGKVGFASVDSCIAALRRVAEADATGGEEAMRESFAELSSSPAATTEPEKEGPSKCIVC